MIGVRYEALGKYVPNFRYYKIIENEFSPKSKKEIKSINAAMFRLEQAGVEDVSECALRLTKILTKEANPELKRDFKLWLNQLIRGYGISGKEVNKIIKELEAGKMTLLEATIKKNREKAVNEGEVKGAEKERAKRDKIIKNLRKLGVSEDKIEEAIIEWQKKKPPNHPRSLKHQ